MTFRIERAPGPVSVRHPANDQSGAPEESTPASLPVPVEAARTSPRAERRSGEASFAAQLIGQDGQKRGLRAGEAFISAAKRAYDRTEWSGSKDRRRRKGGSAKTEI